MNSLRKAFATLALILIAMNTMAAGTESMEEFMFQSGKIYVFFTVSSVILVGMIIYLVSLDRKIGRMEKEIKEENQG